MDYEIHRGESRGQSLSWLRIKLCNNGKCHLRARQEGRREEKSRAANNYIYIKKKCTKIPK